MTAIYPARRFLMNGSSANMKEAMTVALRGSIVAL